MEYTRAEIFKLSTPIRSVRDILVEAVNEHSPIFAHTGRMVNSFFVEGSSGLIPFYVNQKGVDYIVSCGVSDESFSHKNVIPFGIDIPYPFDFIAHQIYNLYEKADYFVQKNFDDPASEHQRKIKNREVAEQHWYDLAEYMRAYLNDEHHFIQYFVSGDFNFEDFPDIEIYEEGVNGFEFNYGGLRLSYTYAENLEPKVGIWCAGKNIHQDNISIMKQKVEMIEQTFKVFAEKIEYYIQQRGLPALV